MSNQLQNKKRKIKESDTKISDSHKESDLKNNSNGVEKEIPLYEFIKISKNEEDITSRFNLEIKTYYDEFQEKFPNYFITIIFDLVGSIAQFESNRIFRALKNNLKKQEKDILLLLLSNGGMVEPAYQISKLCKKYSKNKFVTVIPRQAKSAATLICLGADEIHIGPLGQLGPIDPQLGGLPALGVVQALDRLASLAVKYPDSAKMIARYLQKALTVEQIGYCERISESAVQYAERLLSTKEYSNDQKSSIAKKLVYEYKNHSFVIDYDEAINVLGSEWLKTESTEIDFCEKIYGLFEEYNIFLRFYKKKQLIVIGDLLNGSMIINY